LKTFQSLKIESLKKGIKGIGYFLTSQKVSKEANEAQNNIKENGVSMLSSSNTLSKAHC
jgi:hypothetical protein